MEPQPTNTYGLLFALPGWAGSEQVACFDLTEVDGRLYADSVPSVTTKEGLLRLASLPPDSAVDIYVGSSVAPLGPAEEVALPSGVCIFFIHNFELPGPYLWLTDTLLSAASWIADPELPCGPDLPGRCVVHDSGHRFVCFESDEVLVHIDVAARAFGLSPGDLTLQPGRPHPTDVSLEGRHCHGVYVVSCPDASQVGDHHEDRVPAAVDCRALIQGWFAIDAVGGRVPRLRRGDGRFTL